MSQDLVKLLTRAFAEVLGASAYECVTNKQIDLAMKEAKRRTKTPFRKLDDMLALVEDDRKN